MTPYLLIEAAILQELKLVLNDPTLSESDIIDWSSGHVDVGAGEFETFLPACGVRVVTRATS